MKIILVWAGGIWLSAIAQILHKLWYTNIICIDKSNSEIIEKLKKQWIKTIIWHWKIQINLEDLVIYSDAAINTPEVKNAKRKFSYFEFLWHISKHFKTIWIAGSHWKSTTTWMTIYSFKNYFENKLWLSIVGAFLPDLNWQNFYLNENYKEKIKKIFDHIIFQKFRDFDYDFVKQLYFIVEADEFNYHFLHLDTDWAIITNIDRDHTDIYPTEQDYIKIFSKFIDLVRYKVITNKQTIEKLQKFLKNENFLLNGIKNKLVKVSEKNKIKLSIPWKHNRQNALLVKFLIKEIFNNDLPDNFLQNFKWLWRRLELIYEDKEKNISIFSDYAHHPTELSACREALSEKFPKKNIILIFQPHQARRVLQFFDNFTNILKKFNKVYIYKIYAARENLEEILKFVKQIWKWKKEFENLKNFDEIWKLLASKSSWTYINDFKNILNVIKNYKNSIILIATAGDLDYNIRRELKK